MTNKRNSFAIVLFAMMTSPLLFTTAAHAQYQQQRDRGAVVAGGVAGAIIGGVVGHQNDETPEGALIGGAVGAIAGGLLGNAEDRHIENSWQRQAEFRQHEAQFRQIQAQQVSQAVSINDAITLSQSGVGPGVILNQIQANGVRSRLTVNDIITMSRAGVDESVINAMQQARVAGAAPVAPRLVAPFYAPRPAPVVVDHYGHYGLIHPVPAPRHAWHFEFYDRHHHHHGHH